MKKQIPLFLKKYSFLFIVFISCAAKTFAQQDFIMYHDAHMPERNILNPAFIPECDVHIGLPFSSYYLSGSNTGLSLTQLANPGSYTPSAGGGLYYLMANSKLDWLTYGLHYEDHYFGYNITERVEGSITYPKNLLSVLSGNFQLADSIGLSGMGINFLHYREFAFNYAYEIDYRWTVGARLKYLYGMESIYTRKSAIGVKADYTDLSLNMGGEMEINTSGVDPTHYINPRKTFKENLNDFSFKDYNSHKNNSGVGVDFGVCFKPIENVELSASVVDIGYIHFADNVRNFRQDAYNIKVSKNDIIEMIKKGNFDFTELANKTADTFKKSFTIKQDNNAYDVYLNPRVLAGVSWRPIKPIGINVLADYYFVRGDVMPGGSIGINIRPINGFSYSLNYAAYNSSFTNVGMGVSFNLWPFMLYATCDNILFIAAPEQFTNVHFRIGTNLLIGRKKLYENWKFWEKTEEEE